MKKRISYLMFCLLLSVTVWGQTQEISKETFTDRDTGETLIHHVILHRAIELENDSKAEDISIDLTGDIKRFMFAITTSISAGKLTIEMYDSKGEKQESIAVGSQLNFKKSEIVNGSISKELKEPQPGKWTIKIIPTNATGKIKIQTTVIKRPRA